MKKYIIVKSIEAESLASAIKKESKGDLINVYEDKEDAKEENKGEVGFNSNREENGN